MPSIFQSKCMQFNVAFLIIDNVGEVVIGFMDSLEIAHKHWTTFQRTTLCRLSNLKPREFGLYCILIQVDVAWSCIYERRFKAFSVHVNQMVLNKLILYYLAFWFYQKLCTFFGPKKKKKTSILLSQFS